MMLPHHSLSLLSSRRLSGVRDVRPRLRSGLLDLAQHFVRTPTDCGTRFMRRMIAKETCKTGNLALSLDKRDCHNDFSGHYSSPKAFEP
jgi:hypothetical protein